jgi:uncharacterized protein with FMN-binding domain
MRRAPFVIAGTVAGTAAVLAFPVEASHANVISSGAVAGSGTSSAPTTGTPTTLPEPSTATTRSATITTAPSTTTTSGSESATGTGEQYRYGQLAVTVTVDGSKITNVKIASLSETDPRSVSIDDNAVPQLEEQAIEANSANVDGVSGATFTSDAFAQSLSSALQKLGFH